MIFLGLLQPTSLAIDYADQNVYWSDLGSQSLGVANMKYSPKSNPFLIFGSGIVSPISVTINPIDR